MKAWLRLICLLVATCAMSTHATECSAIFPGNTTFAANGSSVIDGSATCNGGACSSIPTFEVVSPLPSISPSSPFSLTTLTDGVYEHTTWGHSKAVAVTFSGSGTAVVYFRDSVTIDKETEINVGGDPENILIVIYGSLTINKDTQINGHVYVAGSVSINKEVTINGALSAGGSLIVDKNGVFNFDANDVENLNPHGFCESAAPISCDAADSYAEIASDNFSSNLGNWSTNNFNRSVSNWPGESIFNSPGENQNVDFSISAGQLQVADGSYNEYGMVEYDFDGITDTSSARRYAVFSRIDSHSSSATNNDVGIVFGYQDDSNYYLARWTKIGTTYSGSNSFPGTYRQMDLIQVSGGTATRLDSLSRNDTNAGDDFSMKVVVTDDGTGVCVGDAAGNNMALELYSSQTPELHKVGLYSYDNDVGVEYDNFEVRCDDCQQATLKANFRFDECSYSGQAGEVVDQQGTYSGVTLGSVNSLDIGQVERAIDIGLYNQYVETLVPLATNFTVATWFKKPTSTSNSPYFILGAMESGGDLLYLDRGNSWRWGVYTPSLGSVNGSFSFATLDNNWHHMVLVYTNSQTSLYIDGAFIETINIAPSGNLKFIGTSYDAVGTANAQGFRAPLDEFLIYDGALSPAAIANLYSYQSAGKNYDNTDRDPVVCDVTPLAFYQFEQASFSPSIIDSSGNDNNAMNLGGSLDNDSQYCRGFDSGGDNVSSAISNAFRTPIDVDDDIGTKGSVSFWFNSDIDWDQQNERVLFDASECANPNNCRAADKYFTLEIRSDGRLKFSFEDSSDRDYSLVEPSTPVRSANTWYYITTTWDYVGNNFQLYVDGSRVLSSSANSINGQIDDLGTIVFGDNASNYTANGNNSLASPISSHGRFDEVRIYDRVISQAQIVEDMDGTDCDAEPLFLFTHDGSGITCLSENVAVKACTDASCTTTDTTVNTAIDMLINGGAAQSVNIVNGVGTVDFNYTDTVSNAIISSSADYLCTNTSLVDSLGQTNADCGLNFSNAGLVISPIANQVAGVGYSGLTIQAVQANETGACSALFDNTTDIGFAMQYQVPTTTTTNNYTIGGNAIEKSVGAPSAYTDISVDFNASGVGIIPTNIYFDAGQVQLHAYKVIPATPELDAVTLNGNSNNFWVKPDEFVITSPLAGAAGIYGAGVDFSYEINAVNRQGATTTNYLPFDVEASIVRVAPTSGLAKNGEFTFSDVLGGRTVSTSTSFTNTSFSFTNGIATVNRAEYSEVGIVSLDVRDHDYGGIGLEIDADSINLGRFTPSYFEQTVDNHGSITGICGNWAYSGQLLSVGGNGAIIYAQQPELIIVAKNDHGVTTENYRNFGAGDNYAFLENDDVTVTAPTQDLKIGAIPLTPYALSGVINDGEVSQRVNDTTSAVIAGEFSYQLSAMDHFVYTRDANAITAPFSAEFDMQVASIVDSDGVSAASVTPINITSDVEIRFGRLALANSYGPETSDLVQPLSAEYLVDAANMKFTLNVNDSCSVVSNAGSAWDRTNGDTSSGLTAAEVSVQGAAGSMVSGEFNGVLLRSDTQEQGSVNVEFDTVPWLRFDWDGDGSHDDLASAIATFGRYRGNDRIIYWKEVNN